MSLDVTLYDSKVQDAIDQIKIAHNQLFLITNELTGRNACNKALELLDNVSMDKLYSANITHNLNKMAMEAGIYEELWRPEDIFITRARDLIMPLMDGLNLLESYPERFKAFDSPNGWGLYEHFVPFVRDYLQACIKWPNAVVEVSR